MAGKSKFKIPTGKEMEQPSLSSVNSMSRFQNYRQQKTDSANTEQKAPSSSSASDINQHPKQNKPTVGASSTGSSSRVQKSSVNVSNGISGKSLSSSAAAPSSSSLKTTTAGRNPNPSTSKVIVSGTKPVSVTSSSIGESSTTGNISGNSTESSAPGPSKAPSSNSIIVNYRQRGNPILKHVRNVPWEYGSIIPDYVMGKANCALFLSLRYHQLNPTYVHNRLKELGKGYDLRVLLVQVDVTDPHHLLKDLAKICILADCTLMVAFSVEEAGRYLETYKVYENKPPEALMEKTDTDYMSKLTDTLTTVKSVNKTDCMTLLSTFGSFEEIVKATKEDLSLCPGFGPQKAQRLYDVLHEPFVKGRKRRIDELGANEPGSSNSTQHIPAKKPS